MSEIVLYVDDDPSNLVVFEATCNGEFPVAVASGGVEALEIMAHREVAVLLADQRMPGMTGVELCEQTERLHPDTVRMLITAYADLNATIDAINRGKVSRYLRKPWEPAELTSALRDSLEIYGTRRRIQQLERRLVETERTYSLGVVAAGFAHEVRNPLGSLIMGAELVLHWVGELRSKLQPTPAIWNEHVEIVDRVEQHLETCMESAIRIREITDGIDLSHRRTDTQTVSDLRRLLDLTLALVRSTTNRRTRVATHLEAVPEVFGSPAKLGQVVTNLLVNAVQAMPPRPTAENLIDITLRKDGPRVVLEIADNGVGMSSETLERVFDPFFTTKVEGGTGLGLAISKTIVEESGGTIEVTSEEGRGTRFVVRLSSAERAQMP